MSKKSSSSFVYFRQKQLSVYVCRLIDEFAVDYIQLRRRLPMSIRKNTRKRLFYEIGRNYQGLSFTITEPDIGPILHFNPAHNFSKQTMLFMRCYPLFDYLIISAFREIYREYLMMLQYLREHDIGPPLDEKGRVNTRYMLLSGLEKFVGKYNPEIFRNWEAFRDLIRRVENELHGVRILRGESNMHDSASQISATQSLAMGF